MEREYTVDNRVDRLAVRDGIFCEANVASSGSGVEAQMRDFKRRWVKGRVGEGKKTDTLWRH